MLVLGGTGFLGRPLVRHLRAAGHEVAVFHRGQDCQEAALHLHGSRRELAAFAPAISAFNPDVVVDTIAGSASAAQQTMAAVAGYNRRVVLISSMDVYRAWGVFYGTEAGPPEVGLLRETSPLRGRPGPYPPAALAQLRRLHPWMDEGYDKLGMECAAAACARGGWHGRITLLRLPPMYGPGDVHHSLYPLWRRMQDAHPAMVLQRGWAEWRCARGYVENMAAGVALATCDARAAGRVYNLADNGNDSQMEWAAAVAEAAGWQGKVLTLAPALTPPGLRVTANFAQACASDTRSIRRELEFQESVSRGQALALTLAWERAHPPAEGEAAPFDYAAEAAALNALGVAALAA